MSTTVLQKLVFARDTIQKRGLISGARYLRRWYFARLAGYPHTLNFEVTSFCNLKCPFCYTHSQRDYSGRGARKLDLAVYQRVIDGARNYCTKVILHGMGEPLMHGQLFEMVDYAKSRNMDVFFSTNGLLLDDEKVRRIVSSGLDAMTISMDGCSEETYMVHRAGSKPGDFERLKHYIRLIADVKKETGSRTPWISLQFIVTRKNAHEVPQVETMAKELGANEAEMMSLAVDDFVRDPDYGKRVEEEFFVPVDQAFSRYRKTEDGNLSLSGGPNRICPQRAGEPVITSDARIIGCCKDMHTLDDTFGNLQEKGFNEVWNSSEFRQFRSETMMPAKLRKCVSCFPEGERFSKSIYCNPD